MGQLYTGKGNLIGQAKEFEKLGVSVNTAGYHVKQVFAKLGVHDRADVARLLRQA